MQNGKNIRLYNSSGFGEWVTGQMREKVRVHFMPIFFLMFSTMWKHYLLRKLKIDMIHTHHTYIHKYIYT